MYDLPNSYDNKRDGFRCPSPNARSAKLTIHMGEARNEPYEVTVLDESVGGFGVLIDDKANLGPTRCAILDLGEKEVICQITNVRRIKSGEMRLGLKLLEEVEGGQDETVNHAAKTVKANYVPRIRSFGPLILAIVILVGSVVGFVYYECTRVYTDKFGRKQQGSATTAFQKIGSLFVKGEKEKN